MRLRFNAEKPISSAWVAAGPSFASQRQLWRFRGITIIELLIVLAIFGVVVGIGALSGRGALSGQQERAAIRSIQQSVWQGASAASARGRNTELIHIGNRIEVREVDSGQSIRSEELPSGIITNLPNLVFTPPGKISAESFEGVADGISVQSSAGTTLLRVSIIGEVVAEKE
ncbi:MAG: prepilin-type N-terminal cleavage/methylation domain-containing protein [Trueperaceae bacterium]